MIDLKNLADRAKRSAFHLWIFNILLRSVVPFNKPHGFKVLQITNDHIRILLPYKKKNLNHIRGLHACVLATLTEFACGLFLILKLGISHYRIILQRLTMEYHYQGKMDAVAEFGLSDEWIQHHIRGVLHRQESVLINCEVKIYDLKGNHLTTGIAQWQLKDWRTVRTKA